MQYRTFGLRGLLLMLIIASMAAACTAPGPTREEGPARPYRVQVHMTPDQEEAEQRLVQVDAWWNKLPGTERPAPLTASGLQSEVVWQQPYYRVRIGRFGTRQQARDVLAVVQARFPGAFIVRERAPVARR